jgi:hypothetical protein
MSEYVRVLGNLPGAEKGESGFFFLHRSCIKAVYPYWGVVKDNKLYDATRGFDGAKAHFCWVVDFQGNRCRLLPDDWLDVLSKEQIEMMTGEPQAEEEKRQLGFYMPTPIAPPQ